VLDGRVPPWGPLWFGEAGPDLGYPRALVNGVCFPYGHGILVVVDDGVLLLDPFGTGLEG
jgi:hypothetical protein